MSLGRDVLDNVQSQFKLPLHLGFTAQSPSGDYRVTATRQGQEGMEIKLNCQRGKTQIKVEVNPTLRGHLLPLRDLPALQFKLVHIRKSREAQPKRHEAALRQGLW